MREPEQSKINPHEQDSSDTAVPLHSAKNMYDKYLFCIWS